VRINEKGAENFVDALKALVLRIKRNG